MLLIVWGGKKITETELTELSNGKRKDENHPPPPGVDLWLFAFAHQAPQVRFPFDSSVSSVSVNFISQGTFGGIEQGDGGEEDEKMIFTK